VTYLGSMTTFTDANGDANGDADDTTTLPTPVQAGDSVGMTATQPVFGGIFPTSSWCRAARRSSRPASRSARPVHTAHDPIERALDRVVAVGPSGCDHVSLATQIPGREGDRRHRHEAATLRSDAHPRRGDLAARCRLGPMSSGRNPAPAPPQALLFSPSGHLHWRRAHARSA
jgi:hypothetical protein